MNIINAIKDFIIQGLSVVSTFNIEIFIFLFLLCLIGEAFNIFIPYLFETTLLLIGYYFTRHTISVLDITLLLMATELGRLLGAYILYVIGRGGTILLERLMKRLRIKTGINDTWLATLFRRINLLNPFSVAIGRLLWLRIPLTLILSARRDIKTLLLAVTISTLVYDGVYIILGTVVGTTIAQEPIRVLPYMLGGLTVIYLVTFGVRHLLRKILHSRQPEKIPPGS
jgi:membrane-associated protein